MPPSIPLTKNPAQSLLGQLFPPNPEKSASLLHKAMDMDSPLEIAVLNSFVNLK